MKDMASPSHASNQFYQLPMFYSGAELGEMASGDLGGSPVKNWTSEVTARRLLRGDYDDRHEDGIEGHLGPMRQAVERQGGIETPVHVWHDHDNQPWLIDGHHRAQIAMESNRLVPAVHHTNWDKMEAMDSAFMGPTADTDYDQTRV